MGCCNKVMQMLSYNTSEENGRRKIGCFKKDRFSELPLNIQESRNYTMFSPFTRCHENQYFVKKWRRCWTMISHLIFEDDFLDIMLDKLGHYPDQELIAHKIVSVINKAVLQIFSSDKLTMIPLFSRNGIKQLNLEDSEIREISARHSFSFDLTRLRLIRVWFPCRPACEQFTYLMNLELIYATTSFGQGTFHCSVLEKLTLIICIGLLPTNFRAPNLKYLNKIIVK